MNEAHIYLASDSPSFTPVHPQIRAIGPRDLHLWKGRGPRYRGIKKNDQKLKMLFALANLYKIRQRIPATA